MSGTSEAVGWVGIVPEIYFDLISRVAPGTFVALGIGWSLGAFNEQGILSRMGLLGAGWETLVGYVLLFLPAGYVLGLLLTGLAKIHQDTYLTKIWKLEAERYGDLIGKFQTSVLHLDALHPRREGTKVYYQSLHRHIHDYVKSKTPDAKALLPKMSGEANLCDNVVVAAILVLAMGVLRLLLSMPAGSRVVDLLTARRIQLLLVLVGVVTVAEVGARFRHRQLIERQLSFLALELARAPSIVNTVPCPPPGGKLNERAAS